MPSLTAPTLQAKTAPTLPVKKMQLHGVSFSDISSSESEIETSEGSKDCEKDGPNSQVGVAPLKEAVKVKSDDLEDDNKSPSEKNEPDEPVKSPSIEATPPASPTNDTPPVLKDVSPPPIVAPPGHDSSTSSSPLADDDDSMLLSIPLSVVKLSSRTSDVTEGRCKHCVRV